MNREATLVRRPPQADTGGPSHRGTLPVVLAGVFMATLDFFIVNVALPAMQADFSAPSAKIEWIIAAYGLTYSMGLITAGRLGDLWGRRRMLSLGVGFFTATSIACGLAPGVNALILFRVLQGLSAALFAPQVLAILKNTYTGAARARAFNAYAFVMGLASVLGQVIGGLLIRADLFGMGWRSCFLINAPVGLTTLLVIPRWVSESRGATRMRPDLRGMVLVALALVSLVLPLIDGRQAHWPLWSWICLLTTGPLFLGFGRHLKRMRARGEWPLIDPALFRERPFTVGLIVQVVFFMGQAAYFFVFALYTQQGLGLNALQAGLIFLPIGVGYMSTSLVAVHLANRWGRQVIAVGGLLRVAGLGLLVFLLDQIHPGVSREYFRLIPALLIDGAGMGLALAPLAATVLARVSPAYEGAAAGVLTTALQAGNALGVAVIGIVFYHALETAGDARVVHAFRMSLLYLIAIGMLLAILVQALPSAGERGTSAGTASRSAPSRRATEPVDSV